MPACFAGRLANLLDRLLGRLANLLDGLTGGLADLLDGRIGGLANLLACLRCRRVRASTGKTTKRLLRHMPNLRGAADQAATFTVAV
jgi:hypothetical protein